MRYEFLVVLNGHESRVGFNADNQEEAQQMAEEWCGDDGKVIECAGVWKVQA